MTNGHWSLTMVKTVSHFSEFNHWHRVYKFSWFQLWQLIASVCHKKMIASVCHKRSQEVFPQEVLSSPQLTLGEGSVHCVVTRNKKIHIFWDESEIHQIKPNETEYILLTLGEGFMHINSESMLYIQHNYGRPRQWIWRHPPGGLTNGQITLLMRMWECALGYWENTDTKVLKEYTVCSLKCCNIQKCPFNGNIDNLKQGPWCLFI